MKTTSKTIWLTVEAAKSLINKTIVWRAPMDEENWDDTATPKFFGGKCIIRNVVTENNQRHPLEVETISGGRLSYATLENEELQPVNGSETRFSLCPATGDKRTFTYSDLYREVEVIDIQDTEEDDEDKEHENNILEVMFEGDKTAGSKKFEAAIIAFFKMLLNAGEKVKIISRNYDDRTQLSVVFDVVEVKEIERLHISLSAFVGHISDMIGFEISERQQTSDSITLINESGFKLSATAVEA